MNMQVILEIVKIRGISPGKHVKTVPFRTLQREEGNFDCFAKAYAGYYDQSACLWREDCLSLFARHGIDN